MRSFRGEGDRLERELRAARPEGREGLVADIAEHVRTASRRRAARPRFAFAAVMVVVMMGLFATFGGFGYAANAVSQAAHAIVPAKKAPAVADTPSHSQYGKKCGHEDGGPKKPNQRPCPPQAGPKK